MATSSKLPAAKRKQQVYGRLVKRSNWNVDSFFDDEDPSSTAVTSRPPIHHTEQPQQEVESKTAAAIAQASRTHDTFEIPSSDDDQSYSPAKRIIPPTFHKRTALVDDTPTSVAQLAPWEGKKMEANNEKTSKRVRPTLYEDNSPEAQLKQDLLRALSSPEAIKSSSPSSHTSGSKTAPAVHSYDVETGLNPVQSSAMARLAARRQEGHLKASKRLASTHRALDNTVPRKRARASPDSRENTDHLPGSQAPTGPASRESPQTMSDDAADVYDFPGSSGDEQPHRKARYSSLRRTTGNQMKQSNPETYAPRSAVQKGVTAPARLTDIVFDTDSPHAVTTPSSARSRQPSPQNLLSAAARKSSESSSVVANESGTMTPRQSHLWHELLPSTEVVPTEVVPSPSVLPIQDLAISANRRNGIPKFDPKPTESYPGASRRRTRLVDRLKASAPSSDDTSTFENDEEQIKDADKNMSPEIENVPSSDRPTLTKRTPSQIQSSQRQVTAIAHSGPKITYAQSRSYLQEESFEQDFMASLLTDGHDNAAPLEVGGKGVAASQKSAFDLDDSEEDNVAGKIRTIHELRAAGRNVAGMYDIEELLGEIQNHNPSHRGRRRNGLLELATKLMDRTFTNRFTALSLEMELAGECGAAFDGVGNFLLASAMVMILTSEPPQHTVRLFKDQSVLTWLAQLLDQTAEVAVIAASRQNNMSKAAQATLAQFSHTLAKQTSVWPNVQPIALTTRLVALKALDQLVSRLRKLGDRSKLLSDDQIAMVLSSAAEASKSDSQLDRDLAISVLESLSTSTAALTWPHATLQSLAKILPRLDPDSETQQHTVFLMLRLCLNLTNENAESCRVLTESSAVVRYLLTSVTRAFSRLDTFGVENDQSRAFTLDLVVLSMGILINLAELNDGARQQSLQDPDMLSSLIRTFQNGHQHTLEAESVEESITNVAFGYLAVVLANICLNAEAKTFVADRLPGKNLGMLVEAVEEFVAHHSQVDMMNFEGEEGGEVWSAFTEKLKLILTRLKQD